MLLTVLHVKYWNILHEPNTRTGEASSQQMQAIRVQQHRRKELYLQILKKSADSYVQLQKRRLCSVLLPYSYFFHWTGFSSSLAQRQSLFHFKTETRSSSCRQTVPASILSIIPLFTPKFNQGERGILLFHPPFKYGHLVNSFYLAFPSLLVFPLSVIHSKLHHHPTAQQNSGQHSRNTMLEKNQVPNFTRREENKMHLFLIILFM